MSESALPRAPAANLRRSSAVMASGTLVSRVLGFVRAAVLTMVVSTGAAAGQAFDLANKLPNSLYLLLAGGVLNAVLVPQIVRAGRAADGGREFTDRLLTVALSILLGVTVLVTAAAPLLVRLYSKDWGPDLLALATAFAFWCVPQVCFYGVYTLLGQVLNAQGRFGAYMWAPVVNNLVAVAGLAAFLFAFGRGDPDVTRWSPTMVAVLAGTATLGVAAQAVVLLWPLRAIGFAFRPRWGLRGTGLGRASRVAGWTFAALLVGQLGYVVTSRVAAAAWHANEGTQLQLATPGNFSYTNAYLLFMLPHSLVTVSVVTALFTRMSTSAAAGDNVAIRRDLSAGLRVVAVAGVLASAAFVALGPSIARALFAGTDAENNATGQVLTAMAVGLVAFSATYLLQRVCYAYEDARTPFLIQSLVTVVLVSGNLLCALLLPPRWVVVGVGGSMSLANLCGAALALVLLHRRLGSLDGYQVLRTHVRLVIAGVLAGALAWASATPVRASIGPGRLGGLVAVLVGGAVLTLVYLMACRLMRVREMSMLLQPLARLAGPLLRRVPRR